MERRNPKRGGILRVGLDWEVDNIDPPDAEVVELAARKKGLGIYALQSGAAYSFGKSRQDLIVLGYSSVNERDIERAIKRLYDVLDKLVARPSKGRRRAGSQYSASRSRPQRQNGRQYLADDRH